MTSIPFVALSRQHQPLRAELRDAFERVVDGSSFVLGEEVEAFESEFSSFTGVQHVVGVSSGTAALAIALRAAGIGPGDEVIVPAHTFIASALCVLHAGATPVMCDVEAATGLISPASAAGAITPRTAAIVAVHLYGQMADIHALRTLCDQHKLFLLEDAAQAHGAGPEGGGPGVIGDAATFSFYPSKNLGALGEGGAIVTKDAALAARAAAMRNLGQTAKGQHTLLGDNQRLPGLQAALLRVKLPHVHAWNTRRRAVAALYRARLEGSAATLLPVSVDEECVFHLFPVRVTDRDRVVASMSDAGVGVGVHYSPAIPDHAVFTQQPGLITDHKAPNARAWAAETLSLPMHAELTDTETECAADVLIRSTATIEVAS